MRLCVVGLGYVGLPLAVLFARKHEVVGFDISERRIRELMAGRDRTREVADEVLVGSGVGFTTDPGRLRSAEVVVVTVPTPIDSHRNPDLGPILSATGIVARHMAEGTTVVYESTVWPGLTEEECVPLLEGESGLKWKEGFFVGYSPERVNPGDGRHTIDRIIKVVAGDTPRTARLLAGLYGSVVEAGVHVAPDIRTAEAAKVIENTQRDLNIALMNELSLIFGRMGIDTREVLRAAGTKWNFLPFEPGLVGGHCIGVDPYYLTFRAEAMGYHPQMILAGRRINDGMAKHVAEAVVKKLIEAGRKVKGSRVLLLGVTFKENISDIRNSKVAELWRELEAFGVEVCGHDPHAYPEEVKAEYGLELLGDLLHCEAFDGIVLAVRHREYLEGMTLARLKGLATSPSPVLADLKGVFEPAAAGDAGFLYWRL